VPEDARDFDGRRLSFAGPAGSIVECLAERFGSQNQWAARDCEPLTAIGVNGNGHGLSA